MGSNLKINNLRKSIQNCEPLRGFAGLCYKYKDIHILAQAISNNIIPYFIDEIYGKSIEDIYYVKDYDSLNDGTYGFHLNIPYFKFIKGDHITTLGKYQKILKDTDSCEDKQYYSGKIEAIENRYQQVYNEFHRVQH